MIDEIRQLSDEARTYAEAEFAFQKTRVIAVGKTVQQVVVLWVAALIIAVFALVALVAGLLIGLSSLFGPWWATLVIVGGLALAAIIAVQMAKRFWRRMVTRLFGNKNNG